MFSHFRTVLDVMDPHLELAMELEKIALSDEYFVKRKLYPNVDFYSGIVLRAIGIPTSMFTVMFAMARCVGWTSHWLEMQKEDQMRICRPRQLYVGEQTRAYLPLELRDQNAAAGIPMAEAGSPGGSLERRGSRFINRMVTRDMVQGSSFRKQVPDDDVRRTMSSRGNSCQ